MTDDKKTPEGGTDENRELSDEEAAKVSGGVRFTHPHPDRNDVPDMPEGIN